MIIIRIIYALLGVALTLALIACLLAFDPQIELLKVIQALGSLAVGVSATVAFITYKLNTNRHQAEDQRRISKDYLEESIKLLNWAYETFTREGTNPPKNDRLLWLSTARMIVRFRNMRGKITEIEHINIADEQEEYWRLKFYQLLQENKSNFNLKYLMPSNNKYGGDVIHRKSIAVIFDFASWRENMTDPLESIDDKQMFANRVVPIDFHGVEEYLEQFDKYWDEVKQLQEAQKLQSPN